MSTDTAAVEIDLTEYDDKKVNIKLTSEEEAFPATVESATEFALIFRRKGKSVTELCSKGDIESIEIQPETEKELKARRLDPVTLDNVKRHLVDRHGYTLGSVNAMSTEEAFAFHAGLDHDEMDLAHFHADPPAKKDERSEAIAAAEAEAASE